MCIKIYTRHPCCSCLSRTGIINLCSDFVITGYCHSGRSHWNGEWNDTACEECAGSWTQGKIVKQEPSTPVCNMSGVKESQRSQDKSNYKDDIDVSPLDISKGGNCVARPKDAPTDGAAGDHEGSKNGNNNNDKNNINNNNNRDDGANGINQDKDISQRAELLDEDSESVEVISLHSSTESVEVISLHSSDEDDPQFAY